jgi:hypothetical protein
MALKLRATLRVQAAPLGFFIGRFWGLAGCAPILRILVLRSARP